MSSQTTRHCSFPLKFQDYRGVDSGRLVGRLPVRHVKTAAVGGTSLIAARPSGLFSILNCHATAGLSGAQAGFGQIS